MKKIPILNDEKMLIGYMELNDYYHDVIANTAFNLQRTFELGVSILQKESDLEIVNFKITNKAYLSNITVT